ncbi:MAG: mannonate dehydratase [Anaerolineae bacterium]|nr:mannonate dehydratase [Anaerolineae bacterium]
MHLALTLNPFVDADLLYAQQLGVEWIVGDLPGWEADTLAAARNRVIRAGLHLCALDCLPVSLVASALTDQPSRVEATEQVCQIIEDAGKLGIPSLGYRWPIGDSSSRRTVTQGRGAAVSVVHPVLTSEPPTDSEVRRALWGTLTAFLERVVPVAESAGVRLTYQTDVALAALPSSERILDTVSELDLLQEVAGGPAHGLDLHHGFVTAVLRLRAEEAIRHFGSRKAISVARIGSFRRTDAGAQEHFLDQDKVAALRALQAYREVAYEGPLCPIAAPGMTDDSEWRHKGQAFAIGYLRGLIQVLSG